MFLPLRRLQNSPGLLTQLAKQMAAAGEAFTEGAAVSATDLRPYKDLVRFKLRPLLGQLETKKLALERSKEQFETVLHTAKRLQKAAAESQPAAVEVPCDVGNGYRMMGRATDLSVIAVNIGCGVVVDLQPAEAIAAVTSRLQRISEQLQIANSEIQRVQGDIRSAGDALSQLSALVEASLQAAAAAGGQPQYAALLRATR